MSHNLEVVWLIEERHFAFLVQRDAFYSLVRYTRSGQDYEVVIRNDDYEFWEDRAIDYEQD